MNAAGTTNGTTPPPGCGGVVRGAHLGEFDDLGESESVIQHSPQDWIVSSTHRGDHTRVRHESTRPSMRASARCVAITVGGVHAVSPTNSLSRSTTELRPDHRSTEYSCATV